MEPWLNGLAEHLHYSLRLYTIVLDYRLGVSGLEKHRFLEKFF